MPEPLETPRSNRRPGLGYRGLARAADWWVRLIAPVSDKLARGDRGRRAALSRWVAWARTHRDPSRPLLWCHAPSVGEGLQAQAVLTLLRSRHPTWQIMYTHFSPSAERLAARQPVDRADYLPYDTAPNVNAMLSALAPRALVFTKLDLWPELACRASATNARVGMIAATVSPVSRRLRWPARALTAPGYAALDLAGAISEADAARLETLGADRSRLEVTGDPRFDSAFAAARGGHSPLPFTLPGSTLIAGSTWPADEDLLLPAFARVRQVVPDAALVLVPHEPTAAHLARIDRTSRSQGLEPVRLSEAGPNPVPLLVVDRVGILAELYRLAPLAYVGGGFGSAGLHSVLEPAAASAAIVFGPDWQASREAGLLLERGGAIALPRRQPEAELERVWRDWIGDPTGPAARGRKSLGLVEEGLGAAERNAALVERLMS